MSDNTIIKQNDKEIIKRLESMLIALKEENEYHKNRANDLSNRYDKIMQEHYKIKFVNYLCYMFEKWETSDDDYEIHCKELMNECYEFYNKVIYKESNSFKTNDTK